MQCALSAGSLPLFGVILAGGSGTRFWPLSRSQYPKQVLHLLGSGSLLQVTIEGLLPLIPLECLAVVTSTSQADIIKLDLYRHGWYDIKLWLEPQGRNTAPVVALAAAFLETEVESIILGVFPADHNIQNHAGYLKALVQGAALAPAGYLVTFGIVPTRPDTGYGYIQAGAPLKPEGIGFSVQRFIEKPDLAGRKTFCERAATIGTAASFCSGGIKFSKPSPASSRSYMKA